MTRIAERILTLVIMFAVGLVVGISIGLDVADFVWKQRIEASPQPPVYAPAPQEGRQS